MPREAAVVNIDAQTQSSGSDFFSDIDTEGHTFVPVYGVSRCRGEAERWWQWIGSPCSLIPGAHRLRSVFGEGSQE
jgi:hypothetical protein